MPIRHITILGAGLTGLATALKLQKAGFQTLVLERQNQVGGLSKSLLHQGFSFDVGPSSFFTNEPLISQELHELMGGTYQCQMPQDLVWFHDHWIPYPLSLRSLLKIPFRTLSLATSDYIGQQFHYFLPALSELKEHKYLPYDYYRKRLDQLLMREYRKKVTAQPLESIRPAEATSTELISPFWSSLWPVGKEQPKVQRKTTFHRPKEGMGSIAERMRRQIEELGGVVKTNVEIHRIFAPDEEIQAIHFRGERDEWVNTDYLFSTIPLSSLLALIEPLPPHALIELASQLRYKALFFLSIIHKRQNPPPQRRYFFPENHIPFFRAIFAQPTTSQLVGRASLLLSWSLNPNDPLLHASPEKFLALSKPTLQKTGILDQNPILDVQLFREFHALPIHDEAYNQRLQSIRAYLTKIRRIRSIGRQGNFDFSSVDQAIRNGFHAARDIIRERETSQTYPS